MRNHGKQLDIEITSCLKLISNWVQNSVSASQPPYSQQWKEQEGRRAGRCQVQSISTHYTSSENLLWSKHFHKINPVSHSSMWWSICSYCAVLNMSLQWSCGRQHGHGQLLWIQLSFDLWLAEYLRAQHREQSRGSGTNPQPWTMRTKEREVVYHETNDHVLKCRIVSVV